MTDKPESVIPDDLSQEEFERVYGRVAPLSLPEVARLFKDAPFRWWIAGGWSLELDAQPRRHHDDVEIAVAREQLPIVRDWLSDYHLWDIHAGSLTFLWPTLQLPDDHEQLWLRRDAHSPWLLDYFRGHPLRRGRHSPSAPRDHVALQGAASCPKGRRGFRGCRADAL